MFYFFKKSIDFGFHFINLWFMDWPYVAKMYDALKFHPDIKWM